MKCLLSTATENTHKDARMREQSVLGPRAVLYLVHVCIHEYIHAFLTRLELTHQEESSANCPGSPRGPPVPSFLAVEE